MLHKFDIPFTYSTKSCSTNYTIQSYECLYGTKSPIHKIHLQKLIIADLSSAKGAPSIYEFSQQLYA